MRIEKAQNLICPIDGKALEYCDKYLSCEDGHVFDISKQGYINLLLVQQMRSKKPGDSKEMVVARTQYLNTGVYAPIAQKLSKIIQSQICSEINSNNSICIVDSGCGEGYYLDAILTILKNSEIQNETVCIGMDISKHAIAVAAKRNKQITWVVGSNRQPPIASASVDVVVCCFGFPSLSGFSKILKPGAMIILIEPGADHLVELREIIYSEIRPAKTQSATINDNERKFIELSAETLQYKTGILNYAQIKNLFLMTPHFFRATKEGKEAAEKLIEIELTVDVVFRVLIKAR